MKKIIIQTIAVISGTMLQWYDFSLFGYLTPIIASLYFPEKNHVASLLYTFGIFSVSFLLAPLGSILFGYIGDNFGRKKALTLSILCMAIPTMLIAILPSYQSIGILAPFLLVFLRIIQGLVASAEFTGSAIFLVEHSPSNKKFFYGSLTSSAYSFGCISAAFFSSIFTLNFMPSWAWRFSFALALFAGLLVFYMRKNVYETPEFNSLKYYSPLKKEKINFKIFFLKNFRLLLCTVFISGFVGIITFGTYLYTATYLTIYSNLSLSTAIALGAIALIVDASLEPFIAILADKIGGKKISVIGIISIIFLSYPIFHLLCSGKIIYITLGMISMSCLIAITYAPMNTFLILLFPPEYRYTGFGLSFNIGITLFGSTAPLIMTVLINITHNILSPSFYYIMGGLICLAAIKLLSVKKIHKTI